MNFCEFSDLESAISSGGVVSFDCDGTIVLRHTLTVSSNTTLLGNGHRVTISGGGTNRLFVVQSNVTFQAEDLRFSDGNVTGSHGNHSSPGLPGGDGVGAGILNLGGTLILTGCTFSNHWAKGGDSGNPIAPPFRAYTPYRGGSGKGAALYSTQGGVRLTHCVFENNRVEGGMGSPAFGYEGGRFGAEGNGGDGLGGGLYVEGGRLALEYTVFRLNQALGGDTPTNFHYSFEVATASSSDGGMGVGGAICATQCELDIRDATFQSNSAMGSPWFFLHPNQTSLGNGGSARGGAVFLTQSEIGNMERCQFVGNEARSGISITKFGQDGWAAGGALSSQSPLRLADCGFSGNIASGSMGIGGAISSESSLVLRGLCLDNNAADGNGGRGTGCAEGGAVICYSALDAANCTFATNRAIGRPGYPDPRGISISCAGVGGGIAVRGGTVALNHLTMIGNSGSEVYGSSLLPGGAIAVIGEDAKVSLRNSILANSQQGVNATGSVADAGFNLSSDHTPLFDSSTSRNGLDPRVGVLAANGGPTKTFRLLPLSPAIDSGGSNESVGDPALDQRGLPRFEDGDLDGIPSPDIGAYEVLNHLIPALFAIRLSSVEPVHGLLIAGPHTTFSLQTRTDLSDLQWRDLPGEFTTDEGGFCSFPLLILDSQRAFFRALLRQ